MKIALVLSLASGLLGSFACSSASTAPPIVVDGGGGHDAEDDVPSAALAAGCPQALTMDNESAFEGQSCASGGLLCGGSGGFCWIQCVSSSVEAGLEDGDVSGAGHWAGCPGGP